MTISRRPSVSTAMWRLIDFERFRPALDSALDYSDGLRGGRPPYDPVAMFKMPVLAARHNASDARMEFLGRDRMSWLRFLGFDRGQPMPVANTIRMFRERLTRSGGLDALFRAFDRQRHGADYLAMGTRQSIRRWSRPPDIAKHRTTRKRSGAAAAPPSFGPMNETFRTLAVK